MTDVFFVELFHSCFKADTKVVYFGWQLQETVESKTWSLHFLSGILQMFIHWEWNYHYKKHGKITVLFKCSGFIYHLKHPTFVLLSRNVSTVTLIRFRPYQNDLDWIRLESSEFIGIHQIMTILIYLAHFHLSCLLCDTFINLWLWIRVERKCSRVFPQFRIIIKAGFLWFIESLSQ